MSSGIKGAKLLKIIVSLFLAMILGLSPVFVFAAGDQLDGDRGVTVLGESENDPDEQLILVEISTEAELRALATRVNSGDNMAGHLVKLNNNISVDGAVAWVPIGSEAATPFSGVFDGQGFAVSGVKVEKEAYGGLFGFLLDAQIKNLTVSDFVAHKSTGGLFYSAIRSTVDMTRSGNMLRRSLFANAYSNPTVTWDGSMDINSWYTGSHAQGETITIDSCEKLAGLADVVYNGEPFTGVNFILDRNLNMTSAGPAMIAIGDYGGTEFEGRFIGNGFSIIGLEDALFGATYGATITGVTIEGSDINNSPSGQNHGSYGALVNLAINSNISQIHIKNCEITGDDTDGGLGITPGTGGAIGGVWTMLGSSTISQVFVENTNVIGDTYVGGVVGNAEITSITECTVYGGSLENKSPRLGSTGLTGGIFGKIVPIGSAGSAKDCLVVGTDLGNNEYVSGIGWIESYKAAFTNGIVSDVKIGVPDVADEHTFLAVGNNKTIGGAMNIFTDSLLGYNLVLDPSKGSVDGVTNVYWDNHTDHQSNPFSGKNHNQGMSTVNLTDGKWAPANGWKTVENFYPQIGTLANRSWNNTVPIISALAATTPIPGNLDENFVTGAGSLLLPNKIEIEGLGQGVPVNWEVTSPNGALVKISTPKGDIFSSNGTTVSGISITAEIEGYTKEFSDVKIADTKLDFSHTLPRYKDTVDADATPEFIAVFNEPIAENPMASAKYFELIELRTNGEATVEVIPLDIVSNTKYKIENRADGKGYAIFTLTKLQPGSNYKVNIPEEAFTENGNDKALSQAITSEFSTFEAGKPTISFKKELNFAISYDLKPSDLLANVGAKDFDKTVMVDGGTPSAGVTLKEYSGSNWNASDVDSSQRAIIAEIGNNEVQYIVVDDTVFDNAKREGGLYEMFVFAKNAKGRGSVRLMTFSISGSPEWVVAPDPVVHIQWTADKQAIIDAAVQNARAEIKQKNRDALACVVTAEIDDAEWALFESYRKGPDAVKATIIAKDPSGANDLTEVIDVYLDRPLYWTTTPSPVTMHISTKSLVEKKIDFTAGNFNNKVVEYDHSENNYRKPGTYYVDFYSEEQHTTDCPLANCPYDNHPAKRVDDTFIVEIVDTPGYAIGTYWGVAAAEIVSYSQEDNNFESAYVYSKNVINLKPGNQMMPSFIPELLRHQEYGRLELNYSKYRWNLYSNTLDTRYNWSDMYNLGVEIDKVNASVNDAVQVKFAHTGRLFGAVEFDINLDEARLIAAKLPKDNLGLYRYDGVQGKLVLVSNVIVEDGKWASTLINEIYPTSYVLKARENKEVVVNSSPANLNDFIVKTKVFENGIVKDGDPKYVTLPNSDEEYRKLYFQEPTEPVEAKKNSSAPLIAGSIVAIAGIGATAVLLNKRKRKGEK